MTCQVRRTVQQLRQGGQFLLIKLEGAIRFLQTLHLYGFEIYEYGNNPLYTTAGVKKALGSYMAMLDGIKEALEHSKTPAELEQSISKEYGEEDFYLEKDRMYRSEKDVFDEYTADERDEFFGRAPRTVWENLKAFDEHADKLAIFKRDDVMTDVTLDSYREAVRAQWATELHDRIIPDTMDFIRACSKAHDEMDCVDYDRHYWERIQRLRNYLGREMCIRDRCGGVNIR